MTDYHSKPLLGVRVEADLQHWGRDEAKRRRQKFGDFVAGLFTAERDRMAKPVVAAENEQPQQAAPRAHALNCKCGICKNGDQQ